VIPNLDTSCPSKLLQSAHSNDNRRKSKAKEYKDKPHVILGRGIKCCCFRGAQTSSPRNLILNLLQVSSSSYYSKQGGFLPFAQFPSWKEEYGQSVRQQTVRNMTTKDSAGTLLLNCYENKEADPKPVDFAELAWGEQEIIANEKVAPNQYSVSEVLVFEGTFVCVKHCRQLRMQPSPLYLGRLDENLYATEKATAKVTYFAQDTLLPF